MNVTLWGVRGSIPCPGPTTVRYGGNTLCLEVRYGSANHLIIVDAGSGIRALGVQLMKTDFPKGPIEAKILFSHTHWDHILGFPFFTPLFLPTSKLEIFGPVTFEEDTLDKVIGGQMQYRYFPVTMAELAAQLTYHRLQETELKFDDGLVVKTKYLNHPITCLGYRFEHEGKVIVTMFDHEPFRNLFATSPDDPDHDPEVFEEGEKAAREENARIEAFMAGADVVLHDAQYTQKEYLKGRKGWGHSSMEWAINAAARSGVKKLVLIHHDPERTDDQLDELESTYRRAISARSPGGKPPFDLVFAREGMVL
jgi:phosphoribosyl 1,2-cyclic phosphodiesterase